MKNTSATLIISIILVSAVRTVSGRVEIDKKFDALSSAVVVFEGCLIP